MFQKSETRGHHHKGQSDLAKAAENGCRICCSLARRLPTDPFKPLSPLKYKFKWNQAWREHWRIYFYEKEGGRHWGDSVFVHVSTADSAPPGYDELADVVATDLETDPSLVRRDIPTLRAIPESTGHEAVAELAKEWLHDCKHNHRSCENVYGTREAAWYPKRLIHVGNSDQPPHLVVRESDNLKGSYAALSHCWGENPEFTVLSTTNLEDFHQEIPFDKLPASFRDAIVTCQRVGIPYLWIDSLCILQSGEESQKDWLLHSAEMYRVYQNCELNIAIDVSASPHEGAFRSRNPDFLQDCCVWTPFHAPRPIRRRRVWESDEDPTSDEDSDSDWDADFDKASERSGYFPPDSNKGYTTPPPLNQDPASDEDSNSYWDTDSDKASERSGKISPNSNKGYTTPPLPSRDTILDDDSGSDLDADFDTSERSGCSSPNNNKGYSTPSLHSQDPASDKTYLCAVFTEYDFSWTRRHLPLSQRAWVLQEKLLSSRTLHFQQDRISWECKESPALTEYLSDSIASHERGGFDCLFQTQYNIVGPRLDLHGFYEYISEYTDGDLSHPNEDKLIAFAAIAKRFSGYLGEDYCAGIFRSTLPLGLLWDPEFGSCKRATVYRAPSWSWASVDGRIHRRAVSEGETTVLSTLEDVVVDLVDPQNQYGQVKSASLSLTAPLVSWQTLMGSQPEEPEAIEERDDRPGASEPYHWYGSFQGLLSANGADLSLSPDDVGAALVEGGDVLQRWLSPLNNVFVVAIGDFECPRRLNSFSGCYGLVLRRLSDGTYTRIGGWKGDVGFVEKHSQAECAFRKATITII
ncbi:Fc.00g068920.m01.CDS01 [Cosmosporella sp. VM-42]